TGSGKTTTLYSALRVLAGPEVNVSTIEDPIEMVWEGFNQIQVQPKIDLDFAAALRHLLRQDPDI
ncbi:MAG TPA: type II secretion system protein E, partial [Myxococcales bacterium]|nr:type II secretion system protein E [Myxococcales bacterium]